MIFKNGFIVLYKTLTGYPIHNTYVHIVSLSLVFFFFLLIMQSQPIPNGLDFDFSGKSKSQIRALFEKLYPEAFFYGQDPECHIVLEDALQVLKNVGQGATDPSLCDGAGIKLTGKDLVMRIKRSAEYYLQQTECFVYIMFYDRIEKVSWAKGETQDNRDIAKFTKAHDSNMFDHSKNNEIPNQIQEYIDYEQIQNQSKEMKVCNAVVAAATKPKKPNRNYKPDDDKDYTIRRPYLSLNAHLPRDWDLALTDRENTAKHIIAWLVYELFFSTDPACRIDVPIGKMFMVEGHCLNPTMLTKQCLHSESSLYRSVKNRMDITYMPIVKRTIGSTEPDPKTNKYSIPEEQVFFHTELQNGHGEADFNFFFYLSYLSNRYVGKQLVIFSNDTDIMLYALWCWEKLSKGAHWLWKFAPGINWCLMYREPVSDLCKFMDVGIAFQSISGKKIEANMLPQFSTVQTFIQDKKRKKTEDEQEEQEQPNQKKKPKTPLKPIDWKKVTMQISKLSHPVRTLLLTMMIGGGDYIKGYYFITYEKLLFALACHSDYIGDLIKKTNPSTEVCPESYTRLILTAYMMAHAARFDPDDGGSNHVDASIPYIDDPEKYNYETIVQNTKTLGVKNQPPKKKFITASFLHLLFFIRMLDQLGNNTIQDPNYPYHCYSKIYADVEWKRGNVQKMFTFACENFVL